jgi:hypothetical protein
MKTIPSVYGKNGYAYNLLCRLKNVAIYEQKKKGKLFAYEVVKIRIRKGGVQFGKEAEAAEYLPSNEDWGTHGKTYSLSGQSSVGSRMAALAQMQVWVKESLQTAP